MSIEEEQFVAAFLGHSWGHEIRERPTAVITLNVHVQKKVEFIAQAPHVVVDFGKVGGNHCANRLGLWGVEFNVELSNV